MDFKACILSKTALAKSIPTEVKMKYYRKEKKNLKIITRNNFGIKRYLLLIALSCTDARRAKKNPQHCKIQCNIRKKETPE